MSSDKKQEVFRRTKEEIRLKLSAKEALEYREKTKQKKKMEEVFKINKVLMS